MPTNTSISSIFNPGVPDVNPPAYNSRAAETPKLTSTAGILAKEAGSLFADSVKVAHTLTEQDLDDKLHASIDEIRDPYNARLAAALNEAQGQQVAKVQSEPTPTVTRTDVKGNPIGPRGSLDILKDGGDQGPNLPSGLDNLTENLTSLQGARANNKLSRTDYIARLDALAKDFRADYPGWRDYIDQKFHNITGMVPANALIQARISDINSYVGAAQKEKDKIITKFMDHLGDSPDAYVKLAMFKAGRIDSTEATRILGGYMQTRAQAAQVQAQVTIAEGQQKLQTAIVKPFVTNTVNKEVTDSLENVIGLGNFNKNPEEMIAKLTEAKKNPELLQQYSVMLKAQGAKLEATLRNQLTMPRPGFPNGYAEHLGPDGLNKAIEDGMHTHRFIQGLIDDKETGLAGFSARHAKATQDAFRSYMLTNANIAKPLLGMEELLHRVGPNAAAIAMPYFITSGFQSDYNGMIQNFKIDASTPPDPAKPSPTPKPTFGDHVHSTLNAVDRDPNIAPEDKPRQKALMINDIAKMVDGITDPAIDPKLKREWVRYMYSPEGQSVIGQMERDGLGPNGKQGKFYYYNKIHDPRFTDAVQQLGGAEWEMYSKATKATFAQDLLRPEVAFLNKLQTFPDMKLSYDNVNNKFEVTLAPNTNRSSSVKPLIPAFDVGASRDFTLYKDALENKINSALGKLAYVAKKDGADVNAFLISTLTRFGFDPTISQVEGIERKMIEAVAASHETTKQRQDQAKALEDKMRSAPGEAEAKAKWKAELDALRARGGAGGILSPGAPPVKSVPDVKAAVDEAITLATQPQYDENRTKPPRALKKKVQMPAAPNTNLIPEGM